MHRTKEKNTTTKRRPLTVWELPQLIQSVHTHRKSDCKDCKERPHFAAILAFVHRNRFAVASQIQRRFSDYMKSDRTTRRHLAEMESLGWLDVAPTNNTSPLWPKVYHVTKPGLKKLKEALAKQGKRWQSFKADRYRSEGFSAQHILHEIFITEFQLMVWQAVQDRDDLELLTMQRRSLTRHPSFKMTMRGKQTRLEPDGMFLFRQQNRGMMINFVEMDMGTMSSKQIAAKYYRYWKWSESKAGHDYLMSLYERHGAKNPKMAFRILFVIGNKSGDCQQQRVDDLVNLASDQTKLLQKRLWFSSVDNLSKEKNSKSMAIRWQRPNGKREPLFLCPRV